MFLVYYLAKKTVTATLSSYVILVSIAEARKYFVIGLHMRTKCWYFN